MLGRPRESLRELIRNQHQEFMRYQEKRDEELQKRDEESRKRNDELREAAEAQAEETREFNREILLRNEKVYKAVIAEMEEGRKQIQANTKAVLSVLDRLEGSGGLTA
jgi:hypothetical protein